MRLMRVLRLLAVLVAIAGLALVTRPYVHGLSFVIRAADMQGSLRRAADFDVVASSQREISIPTRRGSMRGRVYDPDGAARRTVLLTSGLHVSGIDEPRLVKLARDLAGSRLRVVTPDIPELASFNITPAITDAIEQSARWLATDSGLAVGSTVGMMGISFSGGLSIVAAGRASLADRVAYVFAFGGHDDLPRVLRYLCTGQEPYPPGQIHLKPASDGAGAAGDAPFTRPPHDYGVAVILLGVADRVVPVAQVEGLRTAVRDYLQASALDGGVDRAAAPAAFDRVRAEAAALPEPSKTLATYVVNRDVIHLGARLLPFVRALSSDPALSPSKSPKPTAPVFLLHGSDDNVIPSIESEYLFDDLSGRTHVRLLLSGLISHAEADRPVHTTDVLKLAGFWGDLLAR
ncbi:MAG TPA: hypothetical protein VH583_05840 [Vicinamibacterales bacterium]|jgi:dienelactone hydrolase